MISLRLSRQILFQDQKLIQRYFGASKCFSSKVEEKKNESLVTVFYDGKCGLCSKEINHYKKIAPQGVFHWQDVTQSAEELEKRGISLAESLRLLHATNTEGELHIGVDAFILIWSQLDRWRLLGRLVALPPVRKVADLLYTAFADKRFKKLEHCQIAARKG